MDSSLDLLRIQYLVDQLRGDIILRHRQHHDTIVGQLVQLFRIHLTALSNLLQPVLPDAIQISCTLFTVVVTHSRQCILFHGTLVLADLSHQVLDTQFIVQTLIVLSLAAKTFEVHHTFGIQEDTVSHTGYIIGCLHILVGVGHNPLTALLEVLQGVAQLLSRCRSIEGHSSTL